MAFAVAFSAAVLAGLFHYFGPRGLVYGMPVLGLCARPLLAMMGALPRLAGRIAMRRYEGRYYEFRNHHMDIDIDAQAVCWISTADVRKVIPSFPAEAVIARLHPGLVRETGNPRLWRIAPQALKAMLVKSTDADVGKFLHWLDGDVVSPARKRLERAMPLR